MANTLNTTRKFDTIEAAIKAGQRDYSPAQNKAHHTAIFVAVDGEGRFLMDTASSGYPISTDDVSKSFTRIAYHNGGRWVRNEAAIEALVEQSFNY